MVLLLVMVLVLLLLLVLVLALALASALGLGLGLGFQRRGVRKKSLGKVPRSTPEKLRAPPYPYEEEAGELHIERERERAQVDL